MRRDIDFLASDACEGRGVTTKGINLAADYIANEFKKAGLKPAGKDGSYFQPFTMNSGARLRPPNSFALHGPLGQSVEARRGWDFQVLGLASAGRVTAPVVFVGYGATAKDIDYDDYKGQNVAGKLVLVLRQVPRATNPSLPFDGRSSGYHAALATKLKNAEDHQAAGVLFVSDRDKAGETDRLMDFYDTAFAAGSKLPAIHVKRELADRMLQASLGVGLRDLEADIDRDLKPRSAPLAGWTATVETTVNREATAVKNVVGVLEGSGPLAKETVVVGAHYDHLGYGMFFSLSQDQKGKAIHHGADDNGSGTTTLIELARRFGQQANPRTGRRLVFIAFSGEESGLLGSAYYCQHPLFPLASTAAMVNMDMVGRLRPDKETQKEKLIVYGTGSAKTFDKLIDAANEKFGFRIQKVPTGMGPSDQMSFYLKNIPVYFFFTDLHPDYHRPSDTADKINIPGMAKIADLVQLVTEQLQSMPERPQFVKVPGPAPSLSPRTQGPRLGIQPSYGDDKEGVLLGGVSAGTPAAKAGLKEGDRIVEMAGKPVKNLESYMAIMAGQRKGDVLALAILREGKRVVLKVTLE
jgi:hypothetical protein